MKLKIETKNAPKPGQPYSQAIKVGNMLFTAGQIYLTPEGKLLEGTIEEQTHQVMRNLKSILEEAGFSFSDVIKTTIFISDMEFYGKISNIYGSYMKDPFPARETVFVKELPLGANLEISMIAVKD